jgi:hypothetical protein
MSFLDISPVETHRQQTDRLRNKSTLTARDAALPGLCQYYAA